MRVKNIIKSFVSDYLRVVIAVTNAILAVSMFISPEPHNFFFWATLVFRVISVPIAVFVGNKGLWVIYFIFCNIKALDITYNNYTCVALITLLFALTPKVNKVKAIFMGGLYITDVFIVAGLHNKGAFYIYTHFMLCAQFCTAMWKQKTIHKSDIMKTIILTPDEMNIINQLKDGRPVKQIDGFSEATVYRKLKDAKERNNLKNTEELIKNYI